MARTLATLPRGTRTTDVVSLGVVVTAIPLRLVRKILAATGRTSQRERALPAHVMVYYVIFLALYMEVSCREVLRCFCESAARRRTPETPLVVAGASAIAQARERLGVEPLQQLYAHVVHPVATRDTPGAWYRRWRLVSLDGTTLDVADTPANASAFGRPGTTAAQGPAAYPKLRLVGLVENGTHVVWGAALGPYTTGEVTLARTVLPQLRPEMLCLADRGLLDYESWRSAQATGAALLWRSKATAVWPCEEVYPDGSYRSVLRARPQAGSAPVPIPIRVIEYTLPGVPDAEPKYRLVTTLLNPADAPASELAALYHERWEIEQVFDELKTHLRGARVVMRSKTPVLVQQEVYGLLLAHYAVRGLMHEAALPVGRDPDTLSFLHTVRLVRRTLPRFAAFPPGGGSTGARDDARRTPQ